MGFLSASRWELEEGLLSVQERGGGWTSPLQSQPADA